MTSPSPSPSPSPVAMRWKRVRPGAIAPAYMTAGAAGMDLASAADAAVTIEPGQRASIPTGLAIEIPDGYEGQVRPRSGLARDHGVTLTNSPGTIDADYRGEVMLLLVNLGQEPCTIAPGDRVAQLIIAPATRVTPTEATELSPSGRGTGGFGHTG